MLPPLSEDNVDACDRSWDAIVDKMKMWSEVLTENTFWAKRTN